MSVIFQWVENLRKGEEGKLLLCKQMTEEKKHNKGRNFLHMEKVECVHTL